MRHIQKSPKIFAIRLDIPPNSFELCSPPLRAKLLKTPPATALKALLKQPLKQLLNQANRRGLFLLRSGEGKAQETRCAKWGLHKCRRTAVAVAIVVISRLAHITCHSKNVHSRETKMHKESSGVSGYRCIYDDRK